MVSILFMFIHYLLGNKFVFYVVHMALMYLVNKLHVSNMLAKWLLLFLKYNFKIIYKLGRSHLMANVLNRLSNNFEPIGVLDQTIDAHMFTLQHEWLQNVYEYLLERMMRKRLYEKIKWEEP